MPPTSTPTERRSREPIGDQLRDWRQRRRVSQLALATSAGVSQRHVSFVESGRAMPSRELVLALAKQLEVPFRERNELLLAAGFAPIYRERPLTAPELAPARAAIELVLGAYEPWPAIAVDRHWSLVMSNRAVAPLLARVHPRLLEPPLNVLRVSLHPDGLAPHIVNLAEWREHVLARLETQVRLSADPVLAALLEELRGMTPPARAASSERSGPNERATSNERSAAREPAKILAGVAVPFQLDSDRGRLSFLSTTTVFGTPIDITLSELAIEAFLPADAATAAALRAG
ncbi:MAG TPA: helix-turn-helix transcriptional regulator [Polyangiaceae bacterium]|nr:helix-turn-helix transcriptional regulator [Polyangiaceae bacterium]